MALSQQAWQAIVTDGFAFKIGVVIGNDFADPKGRALLITDGYLYKALSGAGGGITSLWDHWNFINV